MSNESDRIKRTKKALDSISPTACMAKWFQATIYLQNGHNHSCHHPDTHQTPAEELERDPSALVNSQKKLGMRRAMVEGKRPKECDYCWRMEDIGQTSDRVFKSSDDWSLMKEDWFTTAHRKDLYKKPTDPTFLEVSFENTCNFKCAYCGPHISSKWFEEVNRHGPYPTSNRYNNFEVLYRAKKLPILPQDNEYVDAFWKWWPSLIESLHTFRITGGEPLLSKNTFKVLDYLIENPKPNLGLAINSNLCVPDKILDRFFEKVNQLEGKVKYFTLFASIDTLNQEQGDYIRWGMNQQQFMRNIEKYIEKVGWYSSLAFMVTVTNLSSFGFKHLMQWIQYLRSVHSHQKHFTLSTPYLRFPYFMAVDIGTQHILPHLQETLDYVREFSRVNAYSEADSPALAEFIHNNSRNWIIPQFSQREVESVQRIVEYADQRLKHHDEFYVERNSKDFYTFFKEYDRRRGSDFIKIFPEMEEFYNECRKLHEKGEKKTFISKLASLT